MGCPPIRSRQGRIPRQEAFNMFNTVAVAVGSEGKTYTVHCAILGKSSKFFINAMKPEWIPSRASPSTIVLTDGEPAIFEIYIHWLYFKTLPTIDKDQKNTEADAELCILSKCYLLGERLMDIKFKNAILDAFIDAFLNANAALYSPYSRPGKDPITIIYDGTPEKSSVRQLLVKLWANHTSPDWVPGLDDMPSAFKVDLVHALMCRREWLLGKVDPKEFHES